MKTQAICWNYDSTCYYKEQGSCYFDHPSNIRDTTPYDLILQEVNKIKYIFHKRMCGIEQLLDKLRPQSCDAERKISRNETALPPSASSSSVPSYPSQVIEPSNDSINVKTTRKKKLRKEKRGKKEDEICQK